MQEDNLNKEQSNSDKTITNYDFQHPRIVFGKEYMRIVSENSRELARSLSQFFGNLSKIAVDSSINKVNEYTSDQFIETLNDSLTVSQNLLNESEGALFLMFPTDYCHKYINKESGGTGDIKPDRVDLTAIEQKILSRLSKGVLNQIFKVWEPIISMSLKSSIFEKDYELLALKKADKLVVVEFELSFGEVKEIIQIGYTSTFLKEVVSDNFNQSQSFVATNLDDIEIKSFEATIKNMPLTLKVLLGQINMGIDDLNQIQVGDVLPLKQKISQPLNVLAEDKIKFKAYPGQSDGHRSVKLVEIVKETIIKQTI
jgi:flagellar motor switch protein FliM